MASKVPYMFNVEELAARYRVSITTIHRWRLAGRIPAPLSQLGRGMLWRKRDIELFEANAGFETNASFEAFEVERHIAAKYRDDSWSKDDVRPSEQPEHRAATFGQGGKTSIVITAESVAVNLPAGTRLEINDDVATELVGRQVAEFTTLTDGPEK